jgi:beta-N-acetylhexosaminidase
VHSGSGGRLAVAKHFPGHGSSDRLPEEEVATVPKSLDQLESIDLAPIYSVTGNASTPEEITDALLVSHIRYQGLQGNIRATTRPVSLDPQALGLLMELEPLATWRQSGGVMVSDDLGNQAIRRFYDLTSQTFDPRRVAVNAFLAGNDLLYFSDFSSSTETDPFTSATRTLEFFTQKYREDPSFAGRVDESVLRILNLKLRLYANFTLGNVLSNPGPLDELNNSSGVTLMSPGFVDINQSKPAGIGRHNSRSTQFERPDCIYQRCSQQPTMQHLSSDRFAWKNHTPGCNHSPVWSTGRRAGIVEHDDLVFPGRIGIHAEWEIDRSPA